MCSSKSADFLEKNNQEIVTPAFSLERERGKGDISETTKILSAFFISFSWRETTDS